MAVVHQNLQLTCVYYDSRYYPILLCFSDCLTLLFGWRPGTLTLSLTKHQGSEALALEVCCSVEGNWSPRGHSCLMEKAPYFRILIFSETSLVSTLAPTSSDQIASPWRPPATSLDWFFAQARLLIWSFPQIWAASQSLLFSKLLQRPIADWSTQQPPYNAYAIYPLLFSSSNSIISSSWHIRSMTDGIKSLHANWRRARRCKLHARTLLHIEEARARTYPRGQI